MEELTRRVRNDLLQTVLWLAVALGAAIAVQKLVLPMLGI